MELELITKQSYSAANELIERANMKPGQVLLTGCSTSEVQGFDLGSHSGVEIGKAILDGILPAAKEKGIFLAAQCCEHINRAVILEEAAMEKYNLTQVNAVPQPKAGGSFATALYGALESPVAVEDLKAHAGIDIGGVLIGMHLKEVAVPVRLQTRKIGEAIIIAARTRPKFTGGERAVYNDELR
ncbi:MAG: TIGR01440 family protein [Clostridia bacterium]|nr:TIGR01440 family protein [Clostridia bacterium]MBQ6931110.1 TIGR01440 family protein [Clostridia bacterium]MBQ7101510.1 TIGR01440 family protein [Clostridia bacterium]